MGAVVTEREPAEKKMTTDDRDQFSSMVRELSIALGKDGVVFAQALDALLAADKYQDPYLWSWMGGPIIQLPPDSIATQEAIFAAKPDIIIETGVARGGSAPFMASMLQLARKGNV